MFDKYKYNGYSQLVIDGAGLSSHNYNLNNNCIKRKYKDRKISYCKYVLECKLIVGNTIISLDSEWIENTDSLNENKKHRTCNITHLNFRNDTALKNHYFLFKLLIP